MKAILSTVHFLALYAWEVVCGGFRIAWDLYTPGMPISPRMIEIEVPPLDPLQRLLLANLVSMTPGSISVDYHDQHLKIHLLYADTDSDTMKAAVRDRFLPAILSLPFRSPS